ncbi:MAG: isoprenyl transferase [Alphaproteobacteria bacterium]|nr:isoprenyl transferase [Beijerinckiaceae bacterium]NBQ40312.1 isoprenyl transferase [Alphaproteobacteria bacterium]
MSDAIPYIPDHVAIIMDGNGRWASQRGLPRFEGHRRGVDALRRTITAAEELGIRFLTVYSFSSENWRRPVAEIAELMGLLRRFIRNDLADLHARNVRIRVIGVDDGLSADIVALLDEAEKLTSSNTGLTFVVAFNYGSRREIADAVRSLAADVATGRLQPSAITEDMIAGRLSTSGIPDPDLIIRTSGEQRLSNFLLWQASYSELVFSPVLWPDFGRDALLEAIDAYRVRDRRFGGLSAAIGRSR